jgi:hypothetical protein
MVFDANLRWLHAGAKFTARVFAIDAKSQLVKFGIKLHDILECEMITEEVTDCRIKILINGKMIEFKENYIIDNNTWLILEDVHRESA